MAETETSEPVSHSSPAAPSGLTWTAFLVALVAPPKKQHVELEDANSHREIFLKHLARHFGT